MHVILFAWAVVFVLSILLTYVMVRWGQRKVARHVASQQPVSL
jgi:hypothetical protein